MKILFIGDIVGKPGRRAVRELLPGIVEENRIDFVIANCENAAAGFGVTAEIIEELNGALIDVLTSGNHIWDKKEVMGFIEDCETLLRPANYPEGAPGRGSVVMTTQGGARIGVLNLAGRIFMHPLDCPFRTADREIGILKKKADVIIVDMHAEATSEKIAMGWYLDGRVAAVLGTHTHVQTADDRILPGGTAYVTDVGMTGPFDSVIGIKKDVIMQRFLRQIPNKFDVAKGDVRLQAVIVEIAPDGRAQRIQRLNVALEEGVHS
ncbi:MAG: metallophosphoesterase [Syntrophobacterales bacterium RBG_19FT_COMBO_59_10]|nr:MAG: metallophosphoesterase [Syntrophobacterales bacterium RBG_19FT_COMBO_59_10]